MQKVVITDYAFDNIDLEREVLAPRSHNPSAQPSRWRGI